jgi:hypothetical protein
MTGTARPGPDEDLGPGPHQDQDLTEARR